MISTYFISFWFFYQNFEINHIKLCIFIINQIISFILKVLWRIISNQTVIITAEYHCHQHLIGKKATSNKSLNPLIFTLYEKMMPYVFLVTKKEPFNHFHHKNLNYKSAPFNAQVFFIYLDNLTNIKYISINNYTHGS